MTAEAESMSLEFLRRMREDTSRMKDDIHMITDRLAHVERAVRKLAMPCASMSTRRGLMDLRIERRLELAEA